MKPDAYLFDLDGVLTPTAAVHQQAWAEALDGFLDSLGRGLRPFGPDDYLAFVDGRPRYDGVRAFLRSRGLLLPEGSPDDAAGYETVQALGNLKNDAFRLALARDGISPYPDAVELLGELDRSATPWAVVSSSANAHDVLRAAGLLTRPALIVDAQAATSLALAGKPSPDCFVYAAVTLGQVEARCAVVEDAVSGVEAGRAGGFGLVVGVDRASSGAELARAGADRVVRELTELLTAGG